MHQWIVEAFCIRTVLDGLPGVETIHHQSASISCRVARKMIQLAHTFPAFR
jgi:hypothetical protein